MAAAGLASDLFDRGDFGWASGRASAIRLLDLDDPPTAIIGGNDLMTLTTLELAQERDLAVPDDLSLVSFDDTSTYASCIRR